VTTTIEFPVKLTPRARRILTASAEEAEYAGATDYIGVEHIFLAILREGESLPAQVVTRLGFTRTIADELERTMRSVT
jgi:ATP-dependent Clp protease ATP-binding subunit ClpC